MLCVGGATPCSTMRADFHSCCTAVSRCDARRVRGGAGGAGAAGVGTGAAVVTVAAAGAGGGMALTFGAGMEADGAAEDDTAGAAASESAADEMGVVSISAPEEERAVRSNRVAGNLCRS
jgi:hypothetical protein